MESHCLHNKFIRFFVFILHIRVVASALVVVVVAIVVLVATIAVWSRAVPD